MPLINVFTTLVTSLSAVPLVSFSVWSGGGEQKHQAQTQMFTGVCMYVCVCAGPYKSFKTLMDFSLPVKQWRQRM